MSCMFVRVDSSCTNPASRLTHAQTQVVGIAVSVMSLDHALEKRLRLPVPAILKPRALWTGKQVFSYLISLLVQHMDSPRLV